MKYHLSRNKPINRTTLLFPFSRLNALQTIPQNTLAKHKSLPAPWVSKSDERLSRKCEQPGHLDHSLTVCPFLRNSCKTHAVHEAEEIKSVRFSTHHHRAKSGQGPRPCGPCDGVAGWRPQRSDVRSLQRRMQMLGHVRMLVNLSVQGD